MTQSSFKKNNFKINVVLFCGGSGSKAIINSLKNHPQINLNLILNSYDDGKSTGLLRNLIKDMLGPSDIRKNITNLLNKDISHEMALINLLEFRFQKNIKNDLAIELISDLFLNSKHSDIEKFKNILSNIKFQHFNSSKNYISHFLKFIKKQRLINNFFSDCSLGNLIFTGCYLYNNKNFNLTIETLQNDFEIKSKIFNVTNGENLFLSGVRSNGSICLTEADIIKKSKFNISKIYLLKKKYELKKSIDEEVLKKNCVYPSINSEIVYLIKNADLIIYGPGTQNSSLFPSYITKDVGKLIFENRNATKLFISNIIEDNDIINQTLDEILHKFFEYISFNFKLSNNNLNKLITNIFVQKQNSNKNYISFIKRSEYIEKGIKINELDWEIKKGLHAQSLLCSEILNLIQYKSLEKIKNTYHLISIIVPCLNEVKTVEKVINDLRITDFSNLNLNKEIIIVDGGSEDGSKKIINKFNDIKIISMPKMTQKGECLKEAIKNSKGNIIVFFPSDGEYDATDLNSLIETHISNDNSMVIGSRAIKTLNLKKNINKVYENKKILFYISKFGGALISFFMIIRNNVYLSDLLSSIKVFSKKDIANMHVKAKGFDFDIELIISLIRRGIFAIEVPISYKPRSKKDGKKISILDGLKIIFKILFF